MITVDIYTKTGDENLEIDRNFRTIHEGEMEPVILRFHFDESWDTRDVKIVSLLHSEGENRIYTKPLYNNEMIVPAHMLTNGYLKTIVRGFLTTKNMNVVMRDGHLIITDSPKPNDLPGYSYTDRLGGFTITDEADLPHEAWARKKPDDHFVLSDEVIYKETHDVPPASEEPTGYMEAHLLGEEAIYIGRKYNA